MFCHDNVPEVERYFFPLTQLRRLQTAGLVDCRRQSIALFHQVQITARDLK